MVPPPVAAGAVVASAEASAVGSELACATSVGAALPVPDVPHAARKAAKPAIALPARNRRRVMSIDRSIRSAMLNLLAGRDGLVTRPLRPPGPRRPFRLDHPRRSSAPAPKRAPPARQ